MIFDRYPYTNFHELNDDWIIKTLKEFDAKLDEFVVMNSLTYADPILYAVETTYPANTVVICNDTAYVSLQTVPAGIVPGADNAADYWLCIFPFGAMIEELVDADVGVLERHINDIMPSMVNAWMAAHPDVTTTVQPGSITWPKLHDSLKDILLDGYVTDDENAKTIPNSEFEQGNISSGTGEEVPAPSSCRTGFVMFGDCVVKFATLTGYIVAIYEYDSNEEYLYKYYLASGASRPDISAFLAVADHKYRVTILNLNDVMTPADIPLGAFMYQEYYSDYVKHAELDALLDVSPNLFNPATAQDGYYCNPNSGTVSANANLLCTDFIPVTPGDILWFNVSYVRYIAAFKENQTVDRLSGATVATNSGDYEVPANIVYLRLSFTKSLLPADISEVMVNVGSELLPYMPYGAMQIKESVIPMIPVEKITGLNLAQTESLLGSDSLMMTAAALSSGASLVINSAPRHIKKNVGVSALMKFTAFSSVTIGKGYNEYKGRWIVIDSTNITPYYYNGSTAVAGTPVAHGLTITDYLQISMYVGIDGACIVNINTARGTFQTDIDFQYEWNYSPFVFGNQAMTDVQLTYTCADLRCPLWIFGDSYMSVANNRVAGQLQTAGFFNYCLNSLAGISSGDSYADLLKMLAFATPKYIIWALGMNGSNSSTISSLQTLIAKCEEKEINLILYVAPTTPNKDNSELNAFVTSTGLRYVNAYDAVGCNAAGEWYGHGTDNDMLSTDNTHPTVLGAKALAMRFLIDAPEIMQYGERET